MRLSYTGWDDDDDVRFILDSHAWFDVYSASSLKQQYPGKHVTPLPVQSVPITT